MCKAGCCAWEQGEQHPVPASVTRSVTVQAGCAETPLSHSCCTKIALPSIQEITRCLSEAVEGLLQAIPLDMEQEKAKLVLAMVLTKKIANTMPSLLHRVFSTTVNFISQQLPNYIVRLVSAVRQLGLSHSQPLNGSR